VIHVHGPRIIATTFLTALLLASAAFNPTHAHADTARPDAPSRPERDLPPPAKHRLYYANLLAARYNALGLFEEFRLSYRYRMLDSDHILLRDTFAGIGIVPSLSPAFMRIGMFAELQPITMLTLTAQYEAIRYFGAFRVMQSFPDATGEASDTDLSRLRDEKRTYVTTGQQFTLAALLQGKVANFVFRFNTRFTYTDMTLREGDSVYYDIIFDYLAPGRGWAVNNDSDLLYTMPIGKNRGAFTFGLRYSVGHAFYDGAQLPVGVDNPNTPIQRLGPFLAYTFFSKWGERFNNPTVVLLSQWWLSHRYRTGRDVSQAVPMIGIAFTFNGDLWHSGTAK